MYPLSDLMLALGVLNSPVWFEEISMPHWPMPHQLEMMKDYTENTRYGDFSDPGCVSADTEFLTPTGWKRIDQYEEGDLVAQYHPDYRTMTFTEPFRYIKKPCDWLYHVRPSRGVDMVLSPDHRVLHFAPGGSRYRVDTMEEVARLHKEQTLGFRGLFCTTPSFDGKYEIPLTDEELRVQVMVLADGSFTANVGTRCSIRVLKDRKKERCREVLDAAGIPFKEATAPNDYSVFTFYAPLREKNYPDAWWGAPTRQKQVILDEVRHWDGSERKAKSFTFTACNPGDADFIQFVATSCNRNASVSSRVRQIGKDRTPFTEYTVHVSGRGLLQGISKGQGKECTTIQKVDSADGFMYCFSVPSTFLVLRHGGRVFTTGNCGKTFPAQVHAILMAALGNQCVFVMPPKLLNQFEDELLEFFPNIDKYLRIGNLNVSAGQKNKLVKQWDETGWPDILLLSYDVYRMMNNPAPMSTVPRNQWYLSTGETYWIKPDEPRDAQAKPFTKDGREVNKRGKAKNKWQFKLTHAGYRVLFFDEAHALCGKTSIISRAVRAMSEEFGDDVAIYLMTGTPVPTHLEDVYGIIRLINPEAYASYASFERQHCETSRITVRGKGGREVKVKTIIGYSNTDKVYEALYKNSRRVQKRDVLHMPDPIIGQIRVRLSPAHKKLYDAVVKDQFAVLGDRILAPDSQSEVRALAMQVLVCPDQFDEKLSMDNELAATCDTLLDSYNPAINKVIIFAYHKRAIKFLADRYKQWNPAVVYGESAGSKEIDRFKKDDSCRIVIINWVSGGAGLNLQVSHHLIFYECPTSPKDAKQAIARVDRKGQSNIVNVTFLRVMGTISDKNFKNLLKNERSNNQVVRDTKDLLHELLKAG